MRTNDVLATMAEIVEKRMELYKGDFYEYDVEMIRRERPREFAWMVRTTGTHMIIPPEKGADLSYWRHCYDLFKRSNRWFYHVKLKPDGSGEVTLSEQRCDAFAYRMTGLRAERRSA